MLLAFEELFQLSLFRIFGGLGSSSFWDSSVSVALLQGKKGFAFGGPSVLGQQLAVFFGTIL